MEEVVHHHHEGDNHHHSHETPTKISANNSPVKSPIPLKSMSADSDIHYLGLETQANNNVNEDKQQEKKSRKKSVEWSVPDETVQKPIQPSVISLSSASRENISLSGSGSSTLSHTTFDTNLPNPPPANKNAVATNVQGNKAKSPSKPMLSMVITEKPAAKPLSESAMLTKKEPIPNLHNFPTGMLGPVYSHQIEGHYTKM
jgi:hypothetical protein